MFKNILDNLVVTPVKRSLLACIGLPNLGADTEEIKNQIKVMSNQIEETLAIVSQVKANLLEASSEIITKINSLETSLASKAELPAELIAGLEDLRVLSRGLADLTEPKAPAAVEPEPFSEPVPVSPVVEPEIPATPVEETAIPVESGSPSEPAEPGVQDVIPEDNKD